MQIVIIGRRMSPARRPRPAAEVGELTTSGHVFGEWFAEHLSTETGHDSEREAGP
jgi:hypothetical protein